MIVDLRDSSRNVPSEGFDYVVSDNVIEHVDDVETFISEVHRILKPGGVAFHLYPSRWHLVERHLKQPFVHWLPTRRLRKLAIQMFTSMRIEAHSYEIMNDRYIDRSDHYFDYFENKTCYASVRQAGRLYKSYFDCVDYSITGEVIGRRVPIVKKMGLRGLAQFISLRFHTTAVAMRKTGG